MDYTSEFDKAFAFTIGSEGGYVNDPKDPGGETKFGISKRAYPSLDIKNLTIEKAKEIYWKDYWLKAGCDRLPYPFSIYVFDEAVNMGVGHTLTEEKSYPNAFAFLMERAKDYCEMARKDSTKLKYLAGWVERVVRLYEVFPL